MRQLAWVREEPCVLLNYMACTVPFAMSIVNTIIIIITIGIVIVEAILIVIIIIMRHSYGCN